LLLLARSLSALARGDWQVIHSLLGARSIREEAEEEAAYAHTIEQEAAKARQ